jgi:hypothetical protein
MTLAAAGIVLQASSHREAPGIAKYPKLDGTDFYMFRSYETGREGYVTMLANYYPLQDPAGGPNFFMLDENAVYEIHVDNNGDAREDLTFQFRFQNNRKDLSVPVGSKMMPVPLINIGPIGPGRDDTANLNVEETYTLSLIRGPRRSSQAMSVTNAATGTTFKKPVDRIGDKSIRDNDPTIYNQYANDHIYDIDIPGCAAGGRVFAGQRREGFVINIGEIFDLINTNPLGPENGETNDLAGKSVTTLALEVPIGCLVAGDPVIGAWTTSSLDVGVTPGGATPGGPGAGIGPCPAGQPASVKPQDLPGLTWLPSQDCLGWVPAGHPAARSGRGVPGGPAASGTQMSRLAMPLVNEVVIGLKDKDKFNASEPVDDAQFLDYVTHPTLPVLIQVLFGVSPPPAPRNDLVQVFLTGVPGLNRPQNVVPSEMMRLNTSIAPVAPASQNHLGVIGGDLAGFPNGRRPGDDVIDIALRVVEGILLSSSPSTFPQFTDGAATNATIAYDPQGNVSSNASFRLYRDTFPYLRAPLSPSPKPIHQ